MSENNIGYIYKGKASQPKEKGKKYIKLGEEYAHPKCFEKWLEHIKAHTKVVDLHPEEVELSEIWEVRILCGICKQPLHTQPLIR